MGASGATSGDMLVSSVAAGTASDETNATAMPMPGGSSPLSSTSSSWWCNGGVSFGTWNVRSLFGGHRNVATIRARRQLMSKLAGRHDVTMLQEVRGTPSDAALLAGEMSDHVVYSSHVDAGGYGGVLVAIKKVFLERFVDILVQELAPGRILRIHLQAVRFAMNVINIHLEPSSMTPSRRSTWPSVWALPMPANEPP